MRRKKQVTLRDIADELQLTVHTVSKALRGLPGMAESTRRDIFEAARRLGYRTKEQELSLWYEKVPKLLTAGKRFTLLLLKDEAFSRLQFTGLQDRLHEMGHTVTANLLPSTLSDDNRLRDWCEQAGLLYYDGLIIPPAVPEWMEQAALDLPIPKVLINYPPTLAQVDSVIWDVEYAIHQSVHNLVSKGHRRILYVGSADGQRGFRLRWAAFQAAMRKLLDIDADADDHLTEAGLSWAHWCQRLGEKLDSSDGCTAILCAIDHDLQPLMFYLQSQGKQVPADYSVICLETMSPSSLPHLTQPLLLVRESGRRAAERLLWRIANPDAPYEHIRLTGGFLEGETVASRS